jgi:hypothetical protein
VEEARGQQVSDRGEREAMKKYLVMWKVPSVNRETGWLLRTDLVSSNDESKVGDYAAKLNASYEVYEGPSKARRLR